MSDNIFLICFLSFAVWPLFISLDYFPNELAFYNTQEFSYMKEITLL